MNITKLIVQHKTVSIAIGAVLAVLAVTGTIVGVRVSPEREVTATDAAKAGTKTIKIIEEEKTS